jgi:UTP--glucose-1-phosphate uridylyltransferase
MRQMVDVFEKHDGPVVAVHQVPKDEISAYGVIAGTPEGSAEGLFRVSNMVEKPPAAEAPSDLAIIGRYILTPDIFPALKATVSDRTGEIQLTNGLRHLLKSRPVFGCKIDGARHDTGNKLGFLKAVVYFALRRPDLGEQFRTYLKGIDLDRVESFR